MVSEVSDTVAIKVNCDQYRLIYIQLYWSSVALTVLVCYES